MALYQKSVLSKYLKQQDTVQLQKAYKKYTKYFLSPTIQENIRQTKEEQYQGLFLTELFVNVLGYTLKPNADFNLVAEYKNQNNARKADGAILKEDIAIGVIELKGTKTKDLESIRRQAFDYKANQKGCIYVITSNFEKLRFYINDATEFEEFNLFELTEERFALLYLCLHKDHILTNVPLKIKEASILEEEQITKDFYKDYSLFKRELYRDLVKRNGKRLKNISYEEFTATTNASQEETEAEYIRLEKNVKLTLFKKSQKLIDRFLFIFFAEDRGLLPPNSTIQILNKWKADVDFGDERPLYGLFKQYFRFLDKGRQGTTNRAEIYAYNGGLFKEDTILDSLEIDNELLHKYAYNLAKYDFESQVDVNILGHIFENSLNEIESINAEIQGADFDKQKSKRKKDGVFYTPKYITKYIIENTVGKLCEEKKADLKLKEEEYYKGRKNRNKTTIQKLVAILDEYREWLLQLTICDPACGSGAFLNQALDFLITEHNYIDELKAKILGGAIVFSDIENTILENNIYGVDLNEESVEIAKLSLWLRTAQPRRKLNDLSSNIKCGNSLIDSKAVAGNKAFHWETEFPHVFEKGGFDVVIGNPPYVRQELLTVIKPYLEKTYRVYESSQDLFAYFYEKAFTLLKKEGMFGFISNAFDKTRAAYKLRDYLTNETNFITYVDFTEVQVFSGATTYPIILISSNSSQISQKTFEYIKINKLGFNGVVDIQSENRVNVSADYLNSESWNFNSIESQEILDKLKNFNSIKESVSKCFYGIKTGFNEAFIINESTRERLIKEHESSKSIIKPFYEGKDLNKWGSQPIKKYIIFTRRGTDINEFPAIKGHLEKYKQRLTPRNEPEIKVGRKSGKYKWFEIQDSVDYYELFEKPKITWANLQVKNKFMLDEKGYYINAPSVILPSDSKQLLCIINSKLIWFFLKSICVIRSGGYIEVKPQYFEQIPIPTIENEDLFEEKALHVIEVVNDLQVLDNKFQNYLKHKFQLEKLSKKLQNWHELSFGDFIKELNKAIKATNKLRVKEEKEPIAVLTKSDEFEWLELFETKQKEAQELQAQINATDKEIDTMVYNLYGLTEDEIQIVENS